MNKESLDRAETAFLVIIFGGLGVMTLTAFWPVILLAVAGLLAVVRYGKPELVRQMRRLLYFASVIVVLIGFVLLSWWGTLK